MKHTKGTYLNEVAKYIESLGYAVEEVDPNHDLLDVWGKLNGKKCYVEIYLRAFSTHSNGAYGVWGQGDNDDEELFLSNDSIYGLDTRSFPLHILDELQPISKVKRKY